MTAEKSQISRGNYLIKSGAVITILCSALFRKRTCLCVTDSLRMLGPSCPLRVPRSLMLRG